MINDTRSEKLALVVPTARDRFGEYHGLGIGALDFKVCGMGEQGMLAIENTFHAKGGPARHLHFEQEEWFYVLEGEFLVEIGTERVTMGPGDSLLAPRMVPHVWAHVGDGTGRMLVVFSPAGTMEAFFRTVTRANAMPPQDPELWRAHGMQLVGPPMRLDAL